MSLEQRVRSTLKDAASRIDTTAEPAPQPSTTATPGRRPLRPMLAFIASFAAVLLFGVLAMLISGESTGPADDGQAEFSGLLGSIIDLLPEGFEPEHAASLLTLEGNPETIAAEYLEIRIPTIGAGVTRVEEQDGYTLVQWAWGRLLNPDDSQSERGETGWLLLRPTARGHEVIAATTDGVDLSDLTVSEGAVKGTVESDSGQFIGADVLSLEGWPVESAPYPDGVFPDADFLWGTAGASKPPLALDVPVSEPVVVRVNRVGGTLLSISEVVLGSDLAPGDVGQGVEPMPGTALNEQQFEEVFGDEEPGVVIRETPSWPTDAIRTASACSASTEQERTALVGSSSTNRSTASTNTGWRVALAESMRPRRQPGRTRYRPKQLVRQPRRDHVLRLGNQP